MKVYTTDRIRNVVLLGHGGSGKTVWSKQWHILEVLPADWGM